MISYSSPAELLQALIQIPSVNPEGATNTAHTGEEKLAEFLQPILTNLGAESVEIIDILPNRPNIVARFPSASPDKPKLLFAPHLDTVSVGTMTIPPFSGEISNGKIHGRGASDTKGTMAAMLWSFHELREILPTLEYQIYFAGLMGEEAGQIGARALAETFKPDFVIVGEPTKCKVVTAHKGSMWIEITTTGVAAHSSTPEKGDSAIFKMLDLLAWLRPALTERFQKISYPDLGHPTFNFGILQGGERFNIIPNACTLTIDIRLIPDQSPEALLEFITQGARKFDPDLRIDSTFSLPLNTDPSHPLVQRLAASGNGVTTAPWFCDAAPFGYQGVPAVAAGPGSIAQAHTDDEFLSLDDLEKGVRFYSSFLKACQ